MSGYNPKEQLQREAFEAWLAKVDSLVWDEVGMSIDDLPDQDYWGLFTDGFEPREAAEVLFEDCGYEDAWHNRDLTS